jgi:Transposase DDE domain
MQASVTLWEKWQEQVKQLWPSLHGHQQKGLALLVLGIVLSETAVLQRMAESLFLEGISAAKMTSIERRLARLLANERIVVTKVWKQFLGQVLPYWRDQKLRFVLDCTPFDDRAIIVSIGLLVHSRVLPVAWSVMPAQESWDEGQWEIVGRLLDSIIPHLGNADCTLIADRGLAGLPLVTLCRQRQWHYLLRVCKEHTVRRWIHGRWQLWMPLERLIFDQGQHWFGRVLLWQDGTIETSLSAVWEVEQQEAWLLISDQPPGWRRVSDYRLRMRVESTFQDAKSRGWKLEASWIRDRARLDRLLLGLFLAIWWVSHLAACCIHHGQRHRFDRHDRRDKGIFRLGRLWLLDILRRATNPAALTWCLPFSKKGGQWRFALRF